jgi:hypothetical protein
MKRNLLVPILLALSLSPAAASEIQGIGVIPGGLPLFQFGDDFYGGDGGGGGGGGGVVAQDRNLRVSALFTAIPMFSTDYYDDPNASTWTEHWAGGLGGGLDFSYHLAPGFRFGFGSGFWLFSGKTDEAGTTSVEYDDMQMVPIAIDAAFCFPLGLPSKSWFQGGRGFAEGFVPYLGIEIAGLYRTAVGADVHWGSISMDADLLEAGFTLGIGARLGVEFRTGTVGLFADFGFQYFTAPKADDDFHEDPLEMTGWPLRLGIAIYFGGSSGGGGGSY